MPSSLIGHQEVVYVDSLIVINQVNDEWDRNKENMDAYCKEVCKLENKFSGLEFHHVIRDNNVAANVLSKMGSTRTEVPASIFVHELRKPSITEQATPVAINKEPLGPDREIMMIEVYWRTPFIDYIKEHKLPFDKNQVEQVLR